MPNRKDKVRSLMESFTDMHKATKFRLIGRKNFPPVTLAQWGVLSILHQNQSASVKEIAKALGTTSSAATQLTDGLVKKGYILRSVDKKDRRKITLTLSNNTRKQVEKIHNENIEIFMKLFDSLTEKEFDQFYSLQMKILKGVKNN